MSKKYVLTPNKVKEKKWKFKKYCFYKATITSISFKKLIQTVRNTYKQTNNIK